MTESTSAPRVLFELVDGVATITLASPHNRNALSRQLVAELDAAVNRSIADPSVRAAVITGSEGAFCAGADLKEKRQAQHPPTGSPTREFRDVVLTIMRSDLVFVAAVNGAVRAGGTGLVAACDIAIADRSIQFAIPEVRIGIPPAQILVPLLEVVDRRALRRYAFTGEVFDADEAARIGLITAATDDLEGTVAAVLSGLRRAHPGALRRTKRLMNEVEQLDPATALQMTVDIAAQWFASADAQEGINAVLERRVPSWAM